MLKIFKKSVFALAILVLFTVVYSVIYNQPIHFRPKIMAYAESVYSLNPSGVIPDQIMLSPAEEASRSVRLGWRTSQSVENSEVQYWKNADSMEAALFAKAEMTVLDSPELKSDRLIHCFSAVLENLEPATIYHYRAGDRSSGVWSETHSFTTAPEEPAAFSFVYFGDTQKSQFEFGRLLEETEKRYPDTAFYLIAGDLVEDGEWRYLWDAFAHGASRVFAGKPIAPTLGNHDYHYRNGNGIKYFSNYFNTPDNGMPNQAKGRNYSFTYGNVTFIALDSNYDLAGQTQWLENKLAEHAQAQFTIVMFHHPPYTPVKNRDNSEIQKLWVPLFDRYGVDLVLNGHDHSYLRSKKLKNNLQMPMEEEGVIYIISTACNKFYDFIALPEAELQFGNTLTYQRISIEQDEDDQWRLIFKSFDQKHHLKDEFVLEKK